jgi:ribonuclease VapC
VIVLDSSILVGIIRGEPDAGSLLDILDSEKCAVGAHSGGGPPVVHRQPDDPLVGLARRIHRCGPGNGRAVQPRDADAAPGAFDRFGRASGHPARLNFGDCMGYAVSAVIRAPLLFKGGDFGLTDVMAHPGPIRL